ncbi:MAG: hypothetical protein RSB77_05950 [Bacilli bacterium]
MVKVKKIKGRAILTSMMLVAICIFTISQTALAETKVDDFNDVSIEMESSSGKIINIDNSTNDASATITLETENGNILELK